MKIPPFAKNWVPRSVKRFLRPLLHPGTSKYSAELAFWEGQWRLEKGVFENAHYEKLMLAMAGEPAESFLQGKTVADFGCGPRGSLVWARSAALRIGIDVMVDRYTALFEADLVSHDMIYVQCTERAIPLPSHFVDVMFTLNAMDHVDRFEAMAKEIVRIIKPGGEFIGSFNVGEPATLQEPQTLTEQKIQTQLLRLLDVISYRVSNRGPENDPYGPFYSGKLHYDASKPGFLWVRGTTRQE